METGVSPRGEAWGRLARLLVGWMTGTTGTGLQRGRAAKAERERGRACAKWDGGAMCWRCSKGSWLRGQATWSGISACVRACWSMAGSGEVGADWAVPRHSKRERVCGGNSSAR
jgi:hypothetical protein